MALKTIGMPFSFTHPRNGFGERLFTGFAKQSSLPDQHKNCVLTHGSVFYPDGAMVVGNGAWASAARAILNFGLFGTEQNFRTSAILFDARYFYFREMKEVS